MQIYTALPQPLTIDMRTMIVFLTMYFLLYLYAKVSVLNHVYKLDFNI